MRCRTLLIGAIALLSLAGAADRAVAQNWEGQMAQWHQACNQGNRGACVRFGILIGEHRELEAQWRRSHPEWWWWER